MKNTCKSKLMFRLVFTASIVLSLTNLMAQPADSRPIIKYLINNYASISTAACDTCPLIAGKPLRRYKPIPMPQVAAINAIPGFNIDQVPGIAAPNFLGGGSPEIKGLVKNVAGMTTKYAQYVRQKSDSLYFRSGAKGVAVSQSGNIFTSSSTIFPGIEMDFRNARYGIFSFNSTPARLPSFNSTSDAKFFQSPAKLSLGANVVFNEETEVAYFAIDPNNEKIIYVSLRNPLAPGITRLVRKNADGTWVLIQPLPYGVWGALAVDHNGILYIADPRNHVIVKADFDANGKSKSWQTIAGKFGTSGFVNDSNGEDARFNKPDGICIDKDGNVYVGDAGNNVIRKIDNDGDVTTYAGNKDGKAGNVDDNNWEDAKFNGPTALAYNETTKTLYVVDAKNKLIRAINDNRNVSTLAGNAGSANPVTDPKGFANNFYYILAQLNMDPDEAKFDDPTGIAIDPSGFGLYVSDGKYIKYVNTSETIFTITSAIGDSNALVLGLPILPLGIKMNSNNGSFFGIPLVPWKPTTYGISVTNHVGTSLLNGFITFEVVDCPQVPDTIIDNRIISLNQLPYTWNGQVLKGAGTAIATLQGLYGCDSVVRLNLLLKPELNYNSEPYILSMGQQITPIVPTTSGSKIDTFSVSPALPVGLTLNAQTGTITGTPLAASPNQPSPVIGPRTPSQYPAPWSLDAYGGADITHVQISDVNQRNIFENNTVFQSLQGSGGSGIGTAGAYSDFSGLGAIKMQTNTPYKVQLSNALSGGSMPYSLNQRFGVYQYMNSYAVYIDYNRDGDFADAGERVYISAAPQRDAHTEVFNLNLPATALPGVTKMRIYCVEAPTIPRNYFFWDGTNPVVTVTRTTEQALSFYPFFGNISNFASGGGLYDFQGWLDHGEFEDYNIDILNLASQSYVISGSNQLGSAQSIIRIAVNRPSTSSSNTTICSTELPYSWNGLTFSQAGSQTAHLVNIYGADSAATLILKVKQATSSVIAVSNCGPYTYQGQVYTNSGDYVVHLTNSVGCDSAIIFRFRQKANTSVTNIDITPSQLPYTWNGLTFTTAGTRSARLTNAEGCDSTATLVLRVLYNIYYPATNILEVNKPIRTITPQIEGNYTFAFNYSFNGYTISPALPAGLQINYFTGIISGTPTQLSPLQTYTVTLMQDGAKPTTFRLSVGAPSASTDTVSNCGPYTWNGVVYDTAITVTAKLVNQYGFDSTTTLILTIRKQSATTTSLFVNQSELPITWNGINITKEGDKTISLVNTVGCDSAVTVNAVVEPKISYQSPNILQPNQTIVPIAPQNTGGSIPSVIGNVSTLIKANYLLPISIALDAQDNGYVSDELQGTIYKINRRGVVSTINGFGTTQALLAIDKAGNIYAADRQTNRILRRDTAGNVTFLANASLPTGIAVDTAGNVYFSESKYHRIRKISSNGIISTLAGGTTSGYTNGNGTAAKFNMPSGLSVDKAGNVYVADLGNNRIRKITPAGDVTSFSGTGVATSLDGTNSNAGFNAPIDIATDNLGNKYVVDNGSAKIRKIDTAGMVSTLAGTTTGYLDGERSKAKFNMPVSLTTDSHGQVYVADKANAAIRQINSINYTIKPTLPKGLLFDEATGIISGKPIDTLPQPITYTINAFNRAGADSVKIVIAICNPVATSFTLDTCNRYFWIDSIYSSSTTHTRTLKNKGGCDSVVTMRLIIRKGSTGATTTATACGSYVWKGVTYDKTGIYTNVYQNAVGCDSTIYLNLTIKPLSANNLFVDINPSQLPYFWRGKTFTVPGTQSIVLVNSVGCDSILSLTVRISALLPNISYGITDITLYWEKRIEVPITMTNTGTPIPAMKLGERDTLVNFSNNGPGDYLRNTVKGADGAYYTTEFYSNKVFKLTRSGVWSVFADPGGSQVQGMALDKSGNMYVLTNATPDYIKKITPDGVLSNLAGSPLFYSIEDMTVDADNNLVVVRQQINNQLEITKFNLYTSQYVQSQVDYSPFNNGYQLDVKTDSKGNIYISQYLGNTIMKIKPNGQVSGIGQKGTPYNVFQPGNGPSAVIPSISSMAIDSTNDNVYLMAYGKILRVDTSDNVRAVTGGWFEQYKDQVFRVDSGKISIVNNSSRILYTANVYGVGSIPFMNNYGLTALSFYYDPATGVNFKDFDRRIRLDSSGAIVGTPRSEYSSIGTNYASNNSTTYSIIAANQYGISTTPIVIRTKKISYIRESFVTTSLPFVWRGRSFTAATDTATYFVANKTLADDTVFMLHLVYEGPPQPTITATGLCAGGNVTLAANGAAKSAISFDGNNMGLIKNTERSGGSGLAYYGADFVNKPDGSFIVYFRSAFEVWIKPASVSGTQYLLTRDTVKTNGTFFGYSIQNGKFVYEFTKGKVPFVDYKLSSVSNIQPNVWTHVAASFYDSAMYIFINGNLEGTLQTADRFLNPFYSAPDGAGVFPDFFLAGLGSQYGYKGEMDELRLWSTRRNADSVKATMNTIVDPSRLGLGLYYRFDGAVSSGVNDVSSSGRIATLIKPAISVTPSGAPINFASYKWMPGGAITSSIPVGSPSNTLYTITVTDYKNTAGSDTITVRSRESNTIETIRACGSSYTWHGTTYTKSTNSPTWKGTNQFGCDSTVTLNLTLLPLPVPAISGTNKICIGGSTILSAAGFTSYAWLPNGDTTSAITIQPDTTTTYTLKVTDANGCKAIVSKTVVVSRPSSFTEKISACSSYTWHGVTYTSSNNSATWVGVNAAGCDSIVTLNLRINLLPAPGIVSADGEINCMGNPVQLTSRASGKQLLLDGNSRVVEDVMGVDPPNGFTFEGWVNFTSIGAPQTIISQTTGSTPLPFDAWLNANGTVSFAVGNGVNTSTVTTASTLPSKTWNHVAFVYNNKTISIYINGVSSANGVAIIPASGMLNNFMIGNNQSLSRPLFGAVDEFRVWNAALSNVQISANMNLSVLPDSYGLIAYYKFDEEDDQLPVNTATGAPTATIIGNAIHTASTAPIIYQSYNWTGGLTTPVITVTNPGTLYNLMVTDVNGCSASVAGKAEVSAPSTFTEVVNACGSYTWHGVTYTSSNNTAKWTTKNAAGCDSVVTLNLTIAGSSSSIETAVACNYFIWHGVTYTSSVTNAVWNTVNASGCDSVVTLRLTINNSIELTDTVISCGAYLWHDSTYRASTKAPIWYGIGKNSCDSIVHLDLTIADFPVAKINATKRVVGLCQGGLVLRNANNAFTKYATGVNIFSSELTPNASLQILGAPNTYPNYGSSATAWSTKDDQARREFIELTYDNPEPINFIEIYETYNSGSIDTVFVKNPSTNAFDVVYTGTAELYNVPLRNKISFPLTAYPVSTIRIAINAVDVPAQKSIDAVGIGIANTDTYKWSDGSTADTFDVSTAGVYILTATNQFGCSVSDTFNLNPNTLQATFAPPTVTPPANVSRTNSPTSCTVFVSDADLGSASASDNCPGVTVQRTGVPAGNLFPVGVTAITYTATNAAGRTTTTSQTVTITDNQKPVITSNGNKAVNNDQNVCGAFVIVSATATDNCSVGAPRGVRSDGLALTAIYPVGTTTIKWKVKDGTGNAALPVTQTVKVKDNQKPIITFNGNKAVNNDNDVCGAVVNISATATDNCIVGAPTGVRSDGLALTAVYPVGTTTITWNVKDAKGNAALPVIQTITVTDNKKPLVLTKNISVTLVSGTASITASQIDAGSKDNCGIRSIAVFPNTFQCANYGDNTVTLTVTDIYGNIGSKTAIVNVKGAPLPLITVSRTDNTFTGLDGKTIALGYGAQQLTLTASNTTPSTNTTYRWSPAAGLSATNTAVTVFKPTIAGTFVFTVTATNEFGCTASTTVTINVVDVRCGNSNTKVLVCHKTGSVSNPTNQLCISSNAVASHLSNGSSLGVCSVPIVSTTRQKAKPTNFTKEEIKEPGDELTIFALPNPTTNVFKLRITSDDENIPCTVRVLDAFGRTLNQFDKVAPVSTVTFGEPYLVGFYFAEVTQGTKRKVVKLIKGK